MDTRATGLNMDLVRDAQERVRDQLEADRVSVRQQELQDLTARVENDLVRMIDGIGYRVEGDALYAAGAQEAYENMRVAVKGVIREYLSGPAQNEYGALFDAAYDLGHANNTPFYQ